MSASIPPPPPTPLGSPIPALLPHAISVSLPRWADNVSYEEGHPRVMNVLETGYPRFFIHRSIQKLAEICLQRFQNPNPAAAKELCILLPSRQVAQECRAFLESRSPPVKGSRIVEFAICPSESSLVQTPASHGVATEEEVVGGVDCVEIQLILFPAENFPQAKQFWQHAGDGISSRTAERALAFLGVPAPTPLALAANGTNGAETNGGSPNLSNGANGTSHGDEEDAAAAAAKRKLTYSRNRHYSAKPARGGALPLNVSRQSSSSGTARSISPTLNTAPATPVAPSSSAFSAAPLSSSVEDLEPEVDGLSLDHSTYLEERYGRNLPLTSAPLAKAALKKRIAGVLLPHEKSAQAASSSSSGTTTSGEVLRGQARSGGGEEKRVTEKDVFLYPTGMSAIWHAHKLSRGLRELRGGPEGKSICFGFPYTDTLKILEKWGPGCHFFGHGLNSDIDTLATLLNKIRDEKTEHPLLALFCEFPSNPLLRSPDLKRLRALADEHGFLIVVDETIGNFVNVEVASWVDVVVSSLTKVFSGETNVMGGSLVLNPHSAHYEDLKVVLDSQFEDLYFSEDAIYMERNSRDFRARIATINDNAYGVTDWLLSKSIKASNPSKRSVITEVFYPRFETTENYQAMQRFPSTGKGGFGGLFSVTFTSKKASSAFFDNLHCSKGPSLGTNFTLACPYTILAHYLELEWASEYGVEEGLVRVSVGLEEYGALKKMFEVAVEAAEEAEFGKEA